MLKAFILFSVVAFPALADLTEEVKLHCTVSKVDKKIIAGLNEGHLKVFNPHVDNIQTEARVSVTAGTKRRVIQIGESTYDREAKDRSVAEYSRDRSGDWKFVVESGDIEEGFVI